MIWNLILKAIFYTFTLIFGFIGNAFVIYFFSLKMKRASQFRWLVVHLAISDGIYSVITPLQFLHLLHNNNEWKLGLLACKVLNCIGPLTVNVSSWILCLMGFERYRAICHPFSKRLSRTNINYVVLMIWIICIGIKINTFLRLTVEAGECYPSYKSITENIANSLVALLADSLIPMVLLSYYLIRVMLALRTRSKYFLDIKINNRNVKVNKTSLILTTKDSETINKEHIKPEKETSFTNMDKSIKRRTNSCFSDCRMKTFSLWKTMSKRRNTILNFKSLIKKKHLLSNCLDKRGSQDSADRAVIKVFLITVIVFFLTTFPFNAFYFVVNMLYTYYFSPFQFEKYNSKLIAANEWLGLLVLSGSVTNILIYSGKFPDFRNQIKLWLNPKKDDQCTLLTTS
ncbi:rhodopsin, GQ-coupled [Hydra vulgaris]|uniref:Rhodopsin, GQ-coupled n=1 Tax=Hydra vulgaris TaxID=6087 RepID=A0ABM4B5D9_HYDVU